MSMHSSDYTIVDEGLTCGVCGVEAPNAALWNRTGGYCPDHAYLTIPEAHSALRLSRASYYRLVKAGKIHPRKIGTGPNGKILVPRSDVDAILEPV